MADHHRATGEVFDRLFERAQRFDVEVVGRFVEQQDVAAGLQHLGHVDAVAFTAREAPDVLLLVLTLEIERADISPGRGVEPVDLHVVEPVRDFLPDVLLGVEVVAALVDEAEVDGLADLDGAAVGLFLPRDQLEQRGLARAVRPDHADDAAGGQHERQILEQQLVAIGLGDALELNHLAAEALGHLDDDLGLAGAAAGLRVLQFLELLDTRLGLGLAALGAGADPLQLVLDRLLAAGGLAVLLLQTLGLFLKVGRVVALIREVLSAVEFEHPFHHVIEEITVVGDHQHRAGIFFEMVFQPLDALGIEVVGRLVEQQDRRLLDQQAGQRDTALFTAREAFHRPVTRRATQRLHGDLELVVERPAVDRVDLVLKVGHLGAQRIEIGVFLAHFHADLIEPIDHVGGRPRAILDVFQHRLAGVELRLLLQIADSDVLARPGLAGEILVDAGHDLDQRGFTRAVGADDADFGTLIELQVDVAEHRLGRAGEGFGHVLHHEGVLGGHRASPMFGVCAGSTGRRVACQAPGTAARAAPRSVAAWRAATAQSPRNRPAARSRPNRTCRTG